MSIARDLALEVRHKYGLTTPVSDTRLDRLLESHHIEVSLFPFVGRVIELLFSNYLLLSRDLTAEQQRWYKGHALGHWLLHRGNQFWLEVATPVTKAKQETQATIFAGFLLLGQMEDWAWSGMTIEQAALKARVPQENLRLWWHIVSDGVAVGWKE